MNGLYGRTDRPRRVGWALPLAFLLGAAAVMAGCSSGGSGGSGGYAGSGGSGGSTTSTGRASSQQEAFTVLRELVRCARANGMPNLPDPQLDANGQVIWPGGEPPEPTERVQRACRSIIERLPAPPAESADPAGVPALVRFAECIRGHGFPGFPDPRPDGKFDASAFPPGVKPGNPEFDAAMQACGSLNPDPNGDLNVH